MAEKPILFSGPMVRAILDGRKTVTRRVAKFSEWAIANERVYNTVSIVETLNGQHWLWIGFDRGVDDPLYFKSPYSPGDLLWVRETCYICHADDDGTAVQTPPAIYSADGATKCNEYPFARTSIFMPKCATRLWLRVVDVRPERLQEIRPSEVVKEGLPEGNMLDFAMLWNQINGKRAPWESNPWVWRIEFERVEKRA